MAEIIAVANQKGGIGKTTTALALNDILRQMGYRTLYGDLDPQCNGTDNFKAKISGVGTMYDLLINGDIDCIQHTERGDIIAGDPLLKDAGKMLDGVSGAHKLRKGLKEISENYDFVILDTPPALSILLTNALTAAHKVIVPLTPDRFGLQGLVQLSDSIKDVQEYTNPNLKVDGLLMVKFSGRTNLAKGISSSMPEYAKMFDSKVYQTRIRETVAAREAQAQQESLFVWAPNCTAAEDYKAFAEEFLGGIS